jgi:hypothetical protein
LRLAVAVLVVSFPIPRVALVPLAAVPCSIIVTRGAGVWW